MVAIEDRRIGIHVLSYSKGIEEELHKLERRVAAMFRCMAPGGEEAVG